MSSYYLQDTSVPVINVTTPAPTVNVTNDLIDQSNLTCFNLNVIENETIGGNLNVQNISCPGTIYTTTIISQDEYRNNIISSSNLHANLDCYVTGTYFNTRIAGSNILQVPIIENGYVAFSNIIGAPEFTTNPNEGALLSGIIAAAGSLAAEGLDLGQKLLNQFSQYDPLKNPLGEDAASQIQDALNGSNSEGVQIKVDLNSNVKSRYFAQDANSFAYQNNWVIGNLSKIVAEVNPSAWNTSYGMATYAAQKQQTVIDIGQNAVYLANLSNVGKVDLSNILLSNNGTINRGVNNPNALLIESVGFSNGIISGVKTLNSSNVITPLLSNIQSIAGMTTSNMVITTYNSNNTSNNFNFSTAGVLTAPILNAASNYTNALQTQLIMCGSNAVMSNISACNISSCNVSANTITSTQFGISNGVFTVYGDLNVSGVIKSKRISLNELFPPITTAYDPGLYVQSQLVVDGQGNLYLDGINQNALASGTLSGNRISTGGYQNYAANPFG